MERMSTNSTAFRELALAGKPTEVLHWVKSPQLPSFALSHRQLLYVSIQRSGSVVASTCGRFVMCWQSAKPGEPGAFRSKDPMPGSSPGTPEV